MYVDEDGEFFVAAMGIAFKIGLAISAANAVYSGYESARALGTPFGFIVGFNQGFIATTVSAILGDPTGTVSSSLLHSLDFGNDAVSSVGPFNYNWTKGKSNLANPFDDDNLLENINDAYSWGYFILQSAASYSVGKEVANKDKELQKKLEEAKSNGDKLAQHKREAEILELHREGHKKFGRIQKDPITMSVIDPLRELFQIIALYGPQEIAHKLGLREAKAEYEPFGNAKIYFPDAVEDSAITIKVAWKTRYDHPNAYNPYLWWYKR